MSDTLDLFADPVELTAALVDVRSVSGEEAEIADLVERSLQVHAPHLEITRSGNAVLARTNLGRERRVVLAGHLDTVPINQNFPSRREGDVLHGCGTVDMKGGDAVMLAIAALSLNARHDLTFVFYDCEEIEAERNGLTRIQRDLQEWLKGDLAIVCEPSNGTVEAGCQGTMRIEIRTTGKRAHTARAWMGVNAIHGMGEALRRLEAYVPRQPEIDGCRYHEGLQAVKISGGVAGNVVPDEAVLTINHRFAPDRSVEQAEAHLREVFEGFDVTVTDFAGGALPGLHAPAAQELVQAAGGTPVAKLGWTDVARFAALGMPAVNFGPGDPTLAHTREENVPVHQITGCFDVLKRFLLA
ncbi:succinyl-diaminopimelate desuccinylase [Lentzea flava]|uniref:Succinyl-diaminopimelate desuccinylase n=1 Tax=Lentzea flava TaxID=103732 RepID=A0ABQ2V1Y3_9PSEU|nr:succinyl-diaminopimelate desuccinylase [Lentzea flava]MCP2202362.1 succinyldiaminopimelate desuccinylase [Lentzea flava]GGU60921.1 succinyl-diaminopimelate desuccinylase [Lentzea flava]